MGHPMSLVILNKTIAIGILLILCWSHPFYVCAQKESAIWYFGDLAGLDFNVTPPKAISNPNLRTFEGCSSLSDSTGKILFYTDGRTVWNRKDSIMQNGTGLFGDASSTHSSVVFQKPLTSNEYYIVTADVGTGGIGGPLTQNKGVNYSLVNMDNDGGNGSIVSKNNLLCEASAEKIAVTPHRNGIYSWVAIPEGDSSKLRLYLVTENGFELKKTFSGLFPGTIIRSGQIKFSADGRNLAVVTQSATVSIFDFNNETGQLSLSQTIENCEGIYGLEFSPSAKYIYLSTWFQYRKVCQCEVKRGITNYTTDCKFYPMHNISGQLQLGPNQQIYIANNLYQYLSAISSPDSSFAFSGYIASWNKIIPWFTHIQYQLPET
jgi:hypothetical protein